MGTSCSSIKKKNRQKSSIEDEEPFEDESRCSNRSVESLSYGAKSLASNKSKTYLKATITEICEEASSSDQLISPLQSSIHLIKEDNHLTSKLITPSPILSSRSPSPFTPPSSAKNFASSSSGIPNLDRYSTYVGNLLTGHKLSYLPQLPSTKEFCIYLITNNFGTHYLAINKIVPDLKKFFSQKGYEINLYHFNLESLKYTDDKCLKDLCLESMKFLKSKGRLIPLIILEDISCPRLLPQKIFEEDFNVIIDSISSKECKDLFKKWYIKDENNLEPVFVLQSISTHLPSFKSSSIEDKDKALKDLEKEFHQMLTEMEKSIENESILDSYLTSIFDEELKFLNNEESDLIKQVLLARQAQFDKVASNTKKLINKLDESILNNHKLILPSNESNQTNEKNLCDFVINILKKLLEICLEEDIQSDLVKYCSQIGSNLYFELVHQTINCFNLTQNFVGRETFLNLIYSYLSSSLNTPMIITGPEGIGKSSLLAQAFFKSMDWFSSSFIIYRSIGVSIESLTCEQVFRSICEQCCLLYGVHISSASHIIVDGKKILQKILTKVTEERPLIIIIDGLDQVADYSLLNLEDCLFQDLAPFVKLILSTNQGPILDKLQKIWEPDCFFNLEAISYQESFKILENILKQSNRTISCDQKEFLKNQLTSSSLTPLLINLIGREACNWSSTYALFSNLRFSNFEDYTISIFENLSNLIGSSLFITIVTLISCTKYGISDQEVLNIINQDSSLFLNQANSKLEFSFWFYIKLKLSSLLRFTTVEGLLLIHFSNQKIKNLIHKFEQSKIDQFKSSLFLLLNYFKLNDNEKVLLQSRPDPLTNQWPNRRKAQELVWILIQYSTESINFFNDYLLNLKWICFKLSKCDAYQFLEDIQLFVNSNCSKNSSKQDRETLDIFFQLVKSSAYPLRCEGLSILSQLFFRLKALINQNSTLHNSKLETLLVEISQPFVPSLLPLNPLILPQKQNWDNDLNEKPLQETKCEINMFFTIKGDENHVISISTSKGEICVYNIYNSKPVRRLIGIDQPKDLKMIDKFRAVVLCNRDLKIYDLNQGKLESRLKGVMNQKMPFFGLHDENYLVALSRNRMYVNMQSLKTGDLETTFKVGEDRFLNSLLVSANGAMCVCGDETQKPFPLLVWDLSNRKLIYDLRIPHHEFITRLSAISDDGHYVVSVCKELNTTSPNFIIVYDLQSGTLFKKWKPNSNTISIAISSQSSCVVNCVETSLILVWDLSTGAKKLTLYGHSSPVDMLQFNESGQIVLSYDSTKKDRSMRLWDINLGACIAVFTPDHPISCCQLSSNGKVVVMSLTDSSNFHTLILCHNTSIEDELKNVTKNTYGDANREEQVFDLSQM